MDYLHVNADCQDGQTRPIVMKASEHAYSILGRMVDLVRKHRELERKFIEEMAKINNMSTDEYQDLSAEYDFLVDAAEYGVNISTYKSISEAEYYRLLDIAIEEESMELNSDFVEKWKRSKRKQKMHSMHNIGKVRRKYQ